MIKTLSLVIGLLFVGTSAHAFDQGHGLWKKVLDSHRSETGFDYEGLKKGLKANPGHPLILYINELTEVPPKVFLDWPRAEQMAFLINAYNALSAKLIADKYPVHSIKNTVPFFGNPWKKEFFKLLGGQIRSLETLQNQWLRSRYKDARVHSVINTVCLSCPELPSTPLLGSRLEEQLSASFRTFLSDPRRNEYLPEKGEVDISKIFDWYEEDFVASYGSVKSALQKFGPPQALEALHRKSFPTIKYLSFDWGLNKVSEKN